MEPYKKGTRQDRNQETKQEAEMKKQSRKQSERNQKSRAKRETKKVGVGSFVEVAIEEKDGQMINFFCWISNIFFSIFFYEDRGEAQSCKF